MEYPKSRKDLRNAIRAATVAGMSILGAHTPAVGDEAKISNTTKIEVVDLEHGHILETFPTLREAIFENDANKIVQTLVKIHKQIPKNDFARIVDVLPKKITYALSVLSHGFDADGVSDLLKDPALVHVGDIKRSLLFPLVRSHAQKNGPPLIHGQKIMASVLGRLEEQYDGNDAFEVEDAAGYVARNLFERDIPVTNETVRAEVDRIVNVRGSLKNTAFFKNDVIVISFDERYLSSTEDEEGSPRWGSQELVDMIRERQKESSTEDVTLQHFSQTSMTSAEEAKKSSLHAIASTTRPLTIYFDGHGTAKALYLFSNKVIGNMSRPQQADVKITVDEFSDALVERWRAQGNIPETSRSNISFISTACISQNFLRAVADKLRAAHVPVPQFMISSSEYGQSGYTNAQEPTGSRFNKLITTNPTLDDILRAPMDQMETNPSIFTQDPHDPYRPMQISGMVVPNRVG